MHTHSAARRKAVQQHRQRHSNELRATIRRQVRQLRQTITPLQGAGMKTDLATFTRTLDGIDRIVATFDHERDDATATLVPITSALDRMLASLACLRASVALARPQQDHPLPDPGDLNRC